MQPKMTLTLLSLLRMLLAIKLLLNWDFLFMLQISQQADCTLRLVPFASPSRQLGGKQVVHLFQRAVLQSFSIRRGLRNTSPRTLSSGKKKIAQTTENAVTEPKIQPMFDPNERRM